MYKYETFVKFCVKYSINSDYLKLFRVPVCVSLNVNFTDLNILTNTYVQLKYIFPL